MSNTKKQKLTLYFLASKSEHDKEFTFNVHAFDWPGHDFDTNIKMGSVDVEINVPDLNQKEFTLAEIEQLKERIKKEELDSHQRVKAFNDHIQNLLCIEG